MKKNCFITMLAALLICSTAAAQTPQLPSGAPAGQPGKTALPVPNIKPIQPADLAITNISLVSATFDNNMKWWVIKVSITVKNTGGLISAATDITPSLKKTNKPGWNNPGTQAILIGLRPGEAVTKEYSFPDKQKIISPRDSFEFRATVDSGNKVAESNENNNTSAVISVAAPQQ